MTSKREVLSPQYELGAKSVDTKAQASCITYQGQSHTTLLSLLRGGLNKYLSVKSVCEIWNNTHDVKSSNLYNEAGNTNIQNTTRRSKRKGKL